MSTGTNGEVGGADESTRRSGKSESAFRTISEVSSDLNVPQHVLRFWETKFSQIRPMKRGGGRRYYRPEDVALLSAIRDLLYNDGYTIKGAQKLLRENGIKSVISHSEGGRELDGQENAVDREPRFSFEVPAEKESEEEAPMVEREPPNPVDPGPESRSISDGAISDGATPDESPVVVPSAPPVAEPPPAPVAATRRTVDGPNVPMSRLSRDEDEESLSEQGEVPMMAGLTDDQRLELEVVLSDLEDLRRILRQAEL